MVHITSQVLAAIRAHALAAYPEECCGVLIGAAEAGDLCVRECVPGQNLATSNRAVRYSLDPRAFIHADHQARQSGLEVIGFYHSHPDHPALPSSTDSELAWEEYFYLIVPVSSQGCGPVRAWRFRAGAAEALPFEEATHT